MNATRLLQSGNGAFARGDYAQALVNYQRALELVRGDPDLLADLYGNIGNVYGVTGQIDPAILHYKKAVDILRREEDYARLGKTFTNIGNLYADRGDAAEAVHFYQQGAVLLEREGCWEELAILYGNLSMLSLKRSDRAAALEYAEKGMALAKRTKDPARRADALHRLAKAQGALGNHGVANALSEEAQAFYTQVNDELGCAATLFHQAGLHEETGNLAAAVRCLERVVRIDEKYGLPKLAENRARLAKLESSLRKGGN